MARLLKCSAAGSRGRSQPGRRYGILSHSAPRSEIGLQVRFQPLRFRRSISTALLWTAARTVLATVLTPVGPEKIGTYQHECSPQNESQPPERKLPAGGHS
jgi:hypothetical protein